MSYHLSTVVSQHHIISLYLSYLQLYLVMIGVSYILQHISILESFIRYHSFSVSNDLNILSFGTSVLMVGECRYFSSRMSAISCLIQIFGFSASHRPTFCSSMALALLRERYLLKCCRSFCCRSNFQVP